MVVIICLFYCSCEILHDCPECFTPPNGIALRILSKNDSIDLISNGTYCTDSIRIYYLNNNAEHEIDLEIYSDTILQVSRLVSHEISWKSLEGNKDCFLYLNHNDSDTIFINVERITENCCTENPLVDFMINGIQPPYDATDYNYVLWK
jgi:hypothetical protein